MDELDLFENKLFHDSARSISHVLYGSYIVCFSLFFFWSPMASSGDFESKIVVCLEMASVFPTVSIAEIYPDLPTCVWDLLRAPTCASFPRAPTLPDSYLRLWEVVPWFLKNHPGRWTAKGSPTKIQNLHDLPKFKTSMIMFHLNLHGPSGV